MVPGDKARIQSLLQLGPQSKQELEGRSSWDLQPRWLHTASLHLELFDSGDEDKAAPEVGGS
jgi:hypothetical protein